MFDRQTLHAALAGIGIEEPGAAIFEELAAAYGAPSRHYHTQGHVVDCLSLLEQVRHFATRPCEIGVAIWFHDAVYDSHRTDNEEMSARWAERYLAARCAEADIIKRVAGMIRATRMHKADTRDTRLLVDIDLAVLGAPPDVFEAYDRAIRWEYDWVPEEQYRAGRCRVLQGFLDREAIYQTPEMKRRYEARARENLARKVSDLVNERMST